MGNRLVPFFYIALSGILAAFDIDLTYLAMMRYLFVISGFCLLSSLVSSVVRPLVAPLCFSDGRRRLAYA